MDPNESLRLQLAYARRIIEIMDACEHQAPDEVTLRQIAELADGLASRFNELDGWLANGGFKPERWK